MSKMLTQDEIDILLNALNTLKTYADDDTISVELLHKQAVLTQFQIDELIDTLVNVKEVPSHKLTPDVNVVLSQKEIDNLIDALNTVKDYENLEEFDTQIEDSQQILSQIDIDALIRNLMALKGEA